MNKKLLALHGLKWNPFAPELPIEALFMTPKLKNFIWRIEHSQVREGGFALITGDPGTGKSVVLRLLAERLRIPTTSQHRHRVNVSGWVAPLLGRMGMVHTDRGDRQGSLNVLRHLYNRLRRQTLWLYVDGARWHKGQAVPEFLKRHPRLHLEY